MSKVTLESLAIDFVNVTKTAPWFRTLASQQYSVHIIDKTEQESAKWHNRIRLVRELHRRPDETHPILVLFGSSRQPTKNAKTYANDLFGAFIAGTK